MSEPFLAEIRLFGFNFAPQGYARCDGQILSINQNQSLYSLLGTTYGGDGRTTFALPELRGRVPMHVGTALGHAVSLGQRSGAETHTLTVDEIPAHTHASQVSTDSATTGTPSPSVVFADATQPTYHAPGENVAAHSGSLANAGSGVGHSNMQPFLTINFCIALAGVFPSRS